MLQSSNFSFFLFFFDNHFIFNSRFQLLLCHFALSCIIGTVEVSIKLWFEVYCQFSLVGFVLGGVTFAAPTLLLFIKKVQ